MSDTKIEWAKKTAARRLGVSLDEYKHMQTAGYKWCTQCKKWHPLQEFGLDRSRGDGRSSKCLLSRHVAVKKKTGPVPRGFHSFQTKTRDGDKKQARRRVNYLVECGAMLHPNNLACVDCKDGEDRPRKRRHEYDHPHGYDGQNQLVVEVVCSACHRARSIKRGEWKHGTHKNRMV